MRYANPLHRVQKTVGIRFDQSYLLPLADCPLGYRNGSAAYKQPRTRGYAAVKKLDVCDFLKSRNAKRLSRENLVGMAEHWLIGFEDYRVLGGVTVVVLSNL